MLVKTKAIVLHTVKYSESSVVLKCFTRELGLQSYLVSGIKNKKSPVRSGAIQPLNQLNLITYHKGKGNLERIKELKVDYQYTDIPYQPIKTGICLFLAEVLYKSIKEESPDIGLYDFIADSLFWFDNTTEGSSNFHLLFLTSLTHYLGFGPMQSDGEYFDMKEGLYVDVKPLHNDYIAGDDLALFKQMASTTITFAGELKMNGAQRRRLLQILLDYYQLHIDSFATIKSLKVLEELFN